MRSVFFPLFALIGVKPRLLDSSVPPLVNGVQDASGEEQDMLDDFCCCCCFFERRFFFFFLFLIASASASWLVAVSADEMLTVASVDATPDGDCSPPL